MTVGSRSFSALKASKWFIKGFTLRPYRSLATHGSPLATRRSWGASLRPSAGGATRRRCRWRCSWRWTVVKLWGIACRRRRLAQWVIRFFGGVKTSLGNMFHHFSWSLAHSGAFDPHPGTWNLVLSYALKPCPAWLQNWKISQVQNGYAFFWGSQTTLLHWELKFNISFNSTPTSTRKWYLPAACQPKSWLWVVFAVEVDWKDTSSIDPVTATDKENEQRVIAGGLGWVGSKAVVWVVYDGLETIRWSNFMVLLSNNFVGVS